ncbi:uncharacterized protein MYCFIDRAFT_169142 [Pseudocercospora fijiensis CIRAD86]|uniref:Uncharacterized protein n=1 Tax=Pseudocercospora fijiensis (strain CIRAD86) TaxID=383855 RepID=N1Q5N6_PSEFD|nr:uncharacterized protein MYCFIDRAFT_169142 [Pseudocercospora fijiensis CIRAD86]EME87285.1 hypothetical protein MYCFIDRAFT_169142 [Pseudocercospora fijiensis CIRAD86]
MALSQRRLHTVPRHCTSSSSFIEYKIHTACPFANDQASARGWLSLLAEASCQLASFAQRPSHSNDHDHDHSLAVDCELEEERAAYESGMKLDTPLPPYSHACTILRALHRLASPRPWEADARHGRFVKGWYCMDTIATCWQFCYLHFGARHVPCALLGCVMRTASWTQHSFVKLLAFLCLHWLDRIPKTYTHCGPYESSESFTPLVMAKTREQSPSKGKSPKRTKPTAPASAEPKRRTSPRKATPSAKKNSATDTKSPTSSGPRKVNTRGTASPSKSKVTKRTTTPKKVTSTKKAASPKKLISPGKKGKGRKRGSPDEDDSGYDPDQTTDEILAEFDGRTRTAIDKLLITQIRQFEDGGSIDQNVAMMIVNVEHGEEKLECNYKLYWRFRKCCEEEFGDRSPFNNAKPRGPTRSPNKLANAPDLSPSKRSPSRASPKSAAPAAASSSPRRKQTSQTGRLQRRIAQPDEDYDRAEIFKEIERQAFLEETRGEPMEPYPEFLYFLSRSEYNKAQRRGRMAAMQRTETVINTHGTQEEQAPSTYGDSGIMMHSQSSPGRRARQANKTASVAGSRDDNFPQLSPSRLTPARSSPGRSPSTPKRQMATTPARSPTKSTSPGKRRQGTDAPRSPAKPTYKRKYLENGQTVWPQSDKGRGDVVPPIQKDWVEVNDLKEPHKGPQDRENPFFQTMPAAEIWHRRMPPYFPFGETPYMEKVMSDQINADLARSKSFQNKNSHHLHSLAHKLTNPSSSSSPGHEESTAKPTLPAPQSPGILESITSIPGRLAGSISSAFRSPEPPAVSAAAAPKFKAAESFNEIVQPEKWPWHLPEISREEVERCAIGSSVVEKARKRAAVSEGGREGMAGEG